MKIWSILKGELMRLMGLTILKLAQFSLHSTAVDLGLVLTWIITLRFHHLNLVNFCSLQHPCSQMFEELGFTFLPLDWRDRLTSPLSIYPVPEKCESHWSTSHISANSFFQNKHGKISFF